MSTNRFNYSDDFVLNNGKVGINTTEPQEKLDVVGGIVKGQDLKVTGVSSFTSYEGFLEANHTIDESITLTSGTNSSLSGEIIVGTGVTVTIANVGLGTTTVGVGTYTTSNTIDTDEIVSSGQGGIDSLKVYNTFTVPTGGTEERPIKVKPGQLYYNKDFKTVEFWDGNNWRQVDNTTRSGRAVFGGGYSPGNQTVLDVVNIQTQGNAIRFGDLSTSRRLSGSCSSATRGLWGGGQNPGEIQGIEYITLASEGNGISFGNLQTSKTIVTAISSSTRGIWGGGYDTPANINVIDYVEIHTLGNALDFGDLSIARNSAGSVSSPIRGLWGGGDPQTQVIDFITISSKGNAVYFGDLTEIRRAQGTCSNSTRGLFGGGVAPSGSPTSRNTIDYVTIASTGDATDFGDLTVETFYLDAVSTQTRGVFGGGVTINTMSFITITSTGNAQDFGDLVKERYGLSACSDSHGGLGGF